MSLRLAKGDTTEKLKVLASMVLQLKLWPDPADPERTFWSIVDENCLGILVILQPSLEVTFQTEEPNEQRALPSAEAETLLGAFVDALKHKFQEEMLVPAAVGAHPKLGTVNDSPCFHELGTSEVRASNTAAAEEEADALAEALLCEAAGRFKREAAETDVHLDWARYHCSSSSHLVLMMAGSRKNSGSCMEVVCEDSTAADVVRARRPDLVFRAAPYTPFTRTVRPGTAQWREVGYGVSTRPSGGEGVGLRKPPGRSWGVASSLRGFMARPRKLTTSAVPQGRFRSVACSVTYSTHRASLFALTSAHLELPSATNVRCTFDVKSQKVKSQRCTVVGVLPHILLVCPHMSKKRDRRVVAYFASIVFFCIFRSAFIKVFRVFRIQSFFF